MNLRPLPGKHGQSEARAGIPANISNPFLANAQSFQPYNESISALGNTCRRSSGFGPASIAPTVVTTDPIQGQLESTDYDVTEAQDVHGNPVLI